MDTTALTRAESGQSSNYEAPYFGPLIVPWIIMAPALYLCRANDQVAFYLAVATMTLSFSLYGGLMVYYFRAKRRYQKALGIPDWRTKARQKVEDDMAKLD